MKQQLFFITSSIVLLSCQRQLSFPPVPPVIKEKQVAAIVITDSLQVDYDSLVYRYATDKIREVHYSRFRRDSVSRTYFYDAAGRLVMMEDEKALYYTNNDIAKRISFQYDNAGQLVQTLTDFTKVSGVPTNFSNNVSRITGEKNIIIYDTAYRGVSYNLDWANRVIYNTISADNYLLYDSCRYINTFSGIVKTLVSSYTYGANNNVTAIDKMTYFDNEPAEQGSVFLEKDSIAPVYEALRKKLYGNLANWYDAGSALQDDNYRLFTVPGHLYKSIVYSGYSVSNGAYPFKVTRSYEYVNSYDKDLLQKSIVAYSVQGQGTVHYSKFLRYYYQ